MWSQILLCKLEGVLGLPLPDQLYQALLLKMKGQLMILLKNLYGRTPKGLS
jgi:hypothetical protein